jgi:hypothetical protein
MLMIAYNSVYVPKSSLPREGDIETADLETNRLRDDSNVREQVQTEELMKEMQVPGAVTEKLVKEQEGRVVEV